MAPSTEEQPIYAQVVATSEARTIVSLSMFGKTQGHAISGNSHHDRALVWVEQWNAHLEAEWYNINRGPALMMEAFVTCLMSEGVSGDTIKAAMGFMGEGIRTRVAELNVKR